MTAREIVQATRITAVWSALGGGKVRRGRAQAFWRQGDGWSISLSDDRGFWFDHRDDVGGGIIDLIVHVTRGSRTDALRWVADMIGASLDESPSINRRALADAAKIAADAIYFADAAAVLAEEQLDTIPYYDPERAGLTRLIRSLRQSPEAEYLAWWRDGDPKLAAALVHAGRERSRRLQHMLAAFILDEVLVAK